MSAFPSPISYSRRVNSHFNTHRRSMSLPVCCAAQLARITIAAGSRLARNAASSAVKSNSLQTEKSNRTRVPGSTSAHHAATRRVSIRASNSLTLNGLVM